MRTRSQFWTKLIVLVLLLFPLSLPKNYLTIANAQSIEKCKIEASKRNIVSLGFPLRSERLANFSVANVMVIPYQLKGEPRLILGTEEKSIFDSVAKNVLAISNGKLRIHFVYNPTVESSISAADLDTIRNNVQSTWQNDFNNSTYGFSTQIIKQNDKSIDYKGINAIILFGKSSIVNQGIAEAMMYTKDKHQLSNVKNDVGGNWFDPIETDEGQISNVVLLYNQFSAGTVTHELLHNAGLTDLYGSPSSPTLSLMSTGGVLSLLPYEQWVLGWLPDSSLSCISQKDEISDNPINNRFTLDYSNGSRSLVIPTGKTSALIVDVLNFDSRVALIYYSLENDARPPINAFQSNSNSSVINLTNFSGISSQLISPEYTLLVSDNDGSTVTINLIPTAQIKSEQAARLIEDAAQRKIAAVAKAAAEIKARQEADAKAAAELKAKQEAEAKAAAELKAKQEAEARAAAEKAAALKKSTITCIKGKLTKKVTAVNPKCPAGYKKK